MKPCRRCGEVKSLGEFYRHSQMADGHLNFCKDCKRTENRANRQANIEHYRAYDRQRSTLPERQAHTTMVVRRMRENHPEKYKAHTRLNNAVRDGKITRQPCEVCGTNKHVHAHHDDYSKPLDVIWLCAAHHKARHKAMGIPF